VRDLQVSNGVAVVADTFWSAPQGRRALKVEWDEGPLAQVSTALIDREYAQAAGQPGQVARNDGDAEKVLGAGGRVHEAVYQVPFLEHACMEPMNATAQVTDGGLRERGACDHPVCARRTVRGHRDHRRRPPRPARWAVHVHSAGVVRRRDGRPGPRRSVRALAGRVDAGRLHGHPSVHRGCPRPRHHRDRPAAVSCTVPAGATSCTSGAATALLSTGDLIVFRSVSDGSLGADLNLFFGWVCQ
jgi:hypothetical protein